MGMRIPDMEEPKIWRDCAFVSSKLVELKSMDGIDVQMQYPLLRMKHAYERCLLREEAYDRLLLARKRLPKGLHFVIWDAWRPFELQKELFELYSAELIQNMRMEQMTKEEQNKIITKYVSEPVENRELPPVHTTGGAIDLTLADESGKLLNMGTGFDSFLEATHSGYFEKPLTDTEVRDNRRILYETMTGVGYTAYAEEWWHFDYGDRFWAFYNRCPAIYNGIFTKEEAEEHVGRSER